MKVLAGIGGTVLLGVGGFVLYRLALIGLAIWDEIKIARDCPHPEHRVYQLGNSPEYFCDECGLHLTYPGIEDSA